MPAETTRPLSALLSQVLVAFTLELDDEFEKQMRESGYAGASLSVVIWSTLMRFLAGASPSVRDLSVRDFSVRDLAAQSLSSEKRVKFELGCLERWSFITLEADPATERPIARRPHRVAGRLLRDGWGSGRGIRSGWMVRPTAKGRRAIEIWTPLFDEIESRWLARFGPDDIGALRLSLEDIAAQLDFDLPHGIPGQWEQDVTYKTRSTRDAVPMPLPTLLSQVLLAFTLEFQRESRVPLWLCANTLRVLSDQPIPESEIPHLTGCSPETSGLGWQIKPFVVVESAPPPRRGKLVRLSPLGLLARKNYYNLTSAVEKRWEAHFGKQKMRRLRESMSDLFVPRVGERLLIAEGFVPPEATVRSGTEAPALGRRDVGPAAKQRMRDRVAQTALFIRDPVGALPHYPLWDMNRGFGP
jgi:DNA-binding MarR family transcriptional regulator